MFFGADLTQLAFIAMVAVAVGGVALALLFPLISGWQCSRPVSAPLPKARRRCRRRSSRHSARLVDGQKDSRRKQVQETLKQIDERERQRKKRMTLRMMIMQSGLDISPNMFWVISLFTGIAFSVPPLVFGVPWYVAVLGGIVGFLGFPRWFLNFLRKRRQNSLPAMISPMPST